jgi:hypothetical protein
MVKEAKLRNTVACKLNSDRCAERADPGDRHPLSAQCFDSRHTGTEVAYASSVDWDIARPRFAPGRMLARTEIAKLAPLEYHQPTIPLSARGEFNGMDYRCAPHE